MKTPIGKGLADRNSLDLHTPDTDTSAFKAIKRGEKRKRSDKVTVPDSTESTGFEAVTSEKLY